MKIPFERCYTLDTETDLIGAGNVIPEMVCLTYNIHNFETLKTSEVELLANTGVERKLTHTLLQVMLEDVDGCMVGQNLAYDMAVSMRAFPDLTPLIFEAYGQGKMFDTKICDKLLRLSTVGFLADLRFGLADIGGRRLGTNRFQEKEDENSWRLRFSELKGLLSSDYPIGASLYAKSDTSDTCKIFLLQLAEATDTGHGSMNTAAIQAAVDFSLLLATAHGIHTDLDRVALLATALDKILCDENMALLHESKVLRAAVPPKVRNPRKVEKGAEPVWTKGKPAQINTNELKVLVVKVSQEVGESIRYTDPSNTFPEGQVKTDDETLQLLAGNDPVLDKYMERQEVNNLQTTFLPNLQAGIVYPNYDVLKETGRTSSFKGKKNKQLYPSTNVQNQPRIGGELSIREAYVARPGHLIASSDYSSAELCSFAQIIYWLYGKSTLRDQINSGYSPHDYLGAQLCYHLDPGFPSCFPGAPGSHSPDEVYETFLALKEYDRDLHEFYRTLAKPTGLGYPGGLGPKTFRAFAKATYGLTISLEQATYLRELWFFTYPEHRQYLKDINGLADVQNVGLYCYESPLGMFRAGASYCAAANGLGLQTPSAEGAKAAMWEVTRDCRDWTRESLLFGCQPLAFIHDEILLELPEDSVAHERSYLLSETMRICMQKVLPDVTIKADPVLMRRWYKGADPTFDANGRLIPWEPKKSD